MKQDLNVADTKAAALLRVASYLARPQKFVTVANARAEMRRMLEMAAEGSVVLTSHGEPEAAVVPFTTLEDMRRALVDLLVAEMESRFAHSRESLESRRKDVQASGSDDLETLVGETLRGARRRNRKPSRKVSRG